jgi:hypothetical protein
VPQDRESGAAGDRFGRKTAPLVAARIGATMLGRGRDNTADYEGKRAVIKAARQRTTSVGVTYSMLDNLDVIVGAFEEESGEFTIYALDAAFYRDHMRPSRSLSHRKNKVGKVSRRLFEDHGKQVDRVKL